MQRSSSHQTGFTLLEIMLVVTIIAVLIGGAVVMVGPALRSAKETKVGTDLSSLKTDLLMYQAAAGNYPTTEQGLKALTEKPTIEPVPARWQKVLDEVPRDPWQREYKYECPGTHNPDGFDLYSQGAHPEMGAASYIGNWKSSG